MGENPAVLYANALLSSGQSKAGVPAPSFLITAEDSRTALISATNQQKMAICLGFTICKMRRWHCTALLELTFCEWNFQKIPFVVAEQSTFSSSGTAVKPFHGFLVVPISQGRNVSWLLISLKELSLSLRLEPS